MAAFVAFCVVILLKKAQLMEPDDYAYRASIAALSQGHIELTTAQYHALSSQIGGIQQWTQLPNGKWMSEKNPGYPFYAVFFYWIHALRFAPLFAGGLASTSLFIAARKWLGKWAGMYAVIFFLGSGMALAFAYRPTMPTFTDASFIAAGAGALLWAMISTSASTTRRTVIGLLGFLSIEFAVFMRYTNVVVLIVAAAAILIAYKPAQLRRSMAAWWLGSVVAFGGMVLLFNQIVYGHATKTGYANGEITFSFGAIWPNVKHMPNLLVRAVPVVILAVITLGWVTVRLIRSRWGSMSPERGSQARRDGLVVAFVGAGWLGIWALYSAYNWTVQMGGGMQGALNKLQPGMKIPSGIQLPPGVTIPANGRVPSLPAGVHLPTGGMGGGGGSIHLIRFYVPAIGLIALLAVWFVMQLPKWVGPLIAAGAVVTAYGSFDTLIAGGGMGGHLPGGLPNGLSGGGTGGPNSGGFTPPSGNGGRANLPNGSMTPPDGNFGPPGMRNGTMPDGKPPGQ